MPLRGISVVLPIRRNPMNMLRLIAIALPVMLLMACGGGGGGSTNTVARTPTMTPPTDNGGGGDVNPLAELSRFVSTAGSQTIRDIQEITVTSGVNLLSSHAYADEMLELVNRASCNQTLCAIILNSSLGSFGFQPTNSTPNLSFFGDTLNNTNSQITNGQNVDDVTLARGNLTGTKTNIPVEFQTFAGWLDGSIFGTTQTAIGASGSEQYRFISYAVGVPATDNPSSTGSATWDGAVVASIKADRTFILGDAEITVNFTDTNVDLRFDEWRGLDNQAISGMSAITYSDLALSSGSFTGSGNEQVQGRFYGNSHEEVGGFFNTETVTGAFGGTRQ